MKRIILSALVMLFSVATVVSASAVTASSSVVEQEDKVKIKTEELPETVKATLQGADYQGWTVEAAYHVKSADQYEVELKKGAETKTVKFGKDGKAIQ